MTHRALAGYHALVTGGGTGIGRATAAALTASGVVVSVVGRREAPLQATVAAGDAAFATTADVTDEAAIQRRACRCDGRARARFCC